MKIMKKYSSLLMIVLVIVTFILSSCNRDRNHPGWAYMPDMYYSEALNAYSQSEVFRNKRANQLPVPGTIARGHIPYPYKAKSFDEQLLAGKELHNPISINKETLNRGKERYDIFCKICHGIKGDGNGHLYTSKLYPMKPTSLIDDYVQDKPDGEIFHVITLGSVSGLMGAHGSQIKREDRWKIVNYIKTELNKK